MNSEFREGERQSNAATARDMRRFSAIDSALTTLYSPFAARRGSAAFTMIEMLVVIALIGVLSSVLAATVVYAKRVSVQLECKTHLSEIGKTLNTLALNSGGAYPELIDDDGLPWWANVLQELDSASTLGQPGQLPSLMKVFHCRAGGALANFELSRSGTATGGGSTWLVDGTLSAGAHIGSWLRITDSSTRREIRRITSNDGANLGFNRPFPENPGNGSNYEIISFWNVFDSISYGLNFDVKDDDGGDYECVLKSDVTYPDLVTTPPVAADPDKDPDLYYYTEIAKPAEFILVSEADTQDADPANWTGSRISMGAITRDSGDFPPNNAPIVGRHRGHANVLFSDLHVEALEVRVGEHWTKNVNGNTALWTLPDD